MPAMARAAAAVLLALVLGAAAHPPDPPEPLPADTVARVGSTPILKRAYDHWYAIARAGASAPAPGSRRDVEARRDTIGFLIQAEWLRQEAKNRRVRVSRRVVRREFRRQKREAFPNAQRPCVPEIPEGGGHDHR